MARSIKKGPYVEAKLEDKVLAINEGNAKKGVIKTWSRRSTITPDFVGHTFAVHNGNKFIPVYVTQVKRLHKIIGSGVDSKSTFISGFEIKKYGSSSKT